MSGNDIYTKLLVKSQGPDESVVFRDLAAGATALHTITQVGGTKHDDGQVKFSPTALYFDGVNDGLTVSDAADIELGADNFSFDCWVYQLDTGINCIYASTSDYVFGILLNYGAAGELSIWAGSTGTSWNLFRGDGTGQGAAGLVTANAWHHIAVEREGTTWRTYVDGTKDLEFTQAGTIINKAEVKRIGYWGAGWGNWFYGYMSEIRLSKTARYGGSNFTPPSTPYSWTNSTYFDIDPTNIDSDLTDFPVLLKIAAASGINASDMTEIFSELGANDKKFLIATDQYGANPCYVEIEKWDEGSNEAWVWAKIPSVSSTVATRVYLFYDSGVADNVTYVGDTGGIAAQGVWDSNFQAVYHMNSISGGLLLDSTSNNRDATLYNLDDTDLVDGETAGPSLDLDGSSEYIDCGFHDDFVSALSIEVFIKKKVDVPAGKWYHMIGNGSYYAVGIADFPIRMLIDENEYARVYLSRGNDYTVDLTLQGTTAINTTNKYHLATTFLNGGTSKLLLNGGVEDSGASGWALSSTTYGWSIGRPVYLNGGGASDPGYANAYFGEARISNVQRSDAWIKATYYTLMDDLLQWPAASVTVYADQFTLTESLNGVSSVLIPTTELILNDSLTSDVFVGVPIVAVNFSLTDTLVVPSLSFEMFQNLRMELMAFIEVLYDLNLDIRVSKTRLYDLMMDLRITDGEQLVDLLTDLRVTDGTVLKDLILDLRTLKIAPSFATYISHRLTSVIKDTGL